MVFRLYWLPERFSARIIVDLYGTSPDTEIDVYSYLILMALKMIFMLLYKYCLQDTQSLRLDQNPDLSISANAANTDPLKLHINFLSLKDTNLFSNRAQYSFGLLCPGRQHNLGCSWKIMFVLSPTF